MILVFETEILFHFETEILEIQFFPSNARFRFVCFESEIGPQGPQRVENLIF